MMGDEIDLAAKAIGESVGALAEQSGALCPVRELSEWITSFIHYRRQPALARLLMRTAEKVRATGIPPRAVDDKRLRAILDGASMEDEPSMQERWENLLANALTTDESAVPASFAAILVELEPAEAFELDRLVEDQGRAPFSVGLLEPLETRRFENLERLGLLGKVYEISVEGIPMAMPTPIKYKLVVTQLGYELVTACRAPPPTP